MKKCNTSKIKSSGFFVKVHFVAQTEIEKNNTKPKPSMSGFLP